MTLYLFCQINSTSFSKRLKNVELILQKKGDIRGLDFKTFGKARFYTTHPLAT
jgi:hypothetical protein